MGYRNVGSNGRAPGTRKEAGVPVAAQRRARANIPLGRYGEAEEIASAVRFLAGPAASFLTGQTIQVNGGQMMF